MTQLTFQEAVEELRRVYELGFGGRSGPVVPSLTTLVPTDLDPSAIQMSTLHIVGTELTKPTAEGQARLAKRLAALRAYLDFTLSWRSADSQIMYGSAEFRNFFEKLNEYATS